MSITIGAIAMTRSSTIAVVQVVQPRFEPPATTNRSTSLPPPSSVAAKAVIVSIARTAAFVIGSRASQISSSPRRNLSQP